MLICSQSFKLFGITLLCIIGYFSSLQTTFAHSPHIETFHKTANRTFTVPIHLLGSDLFSSDLSQNQDILFSEDDDHSFGVSAVFLNVEGSMLSFDASEELYSNAETFFAKQGHIDHLLQEKTSEKTTTSQ